MHSMFTSQEIYDDLCMKIETLFYMPGEKLSENELAAKYNVSRHIIRGALASLKNRKLVEVYPQRGTYVSLIDTEYISDILFTRESSEKEAISRIIALGKEKEVAGRLKLLVDAMSKLSEGASFQQEFYELDNLFHQSLFTAIGRENVMELIERPYIHVKRWRNYEVRTRERMQEILEEHAQIANALEKRDEATAREVLHKHLDTATRYSKPLKETEAQYFVQ